MIRDPTEPEPVDLWAEYRALQADAPKASVQYAVVVGDRAQAKGLLKQKVRELGEGVLVVMGSHARTGLGRFLWGSNAEEVLRELPCPVLVARSPAPAVVPPSGAIETMVSA